jgi:hypothetical protein
MKCRKQMRTVSSMGDIKTMKKSEVGKSVGAQSSAFLKLEKPEKFKKLP